VSIEVTSIFSLSLHQVLMLLEEGSWMA
jgi:hypothetical protein